MKKHILLLAAAALTALACDKNAEELTPVTPEEFDYSNTPVRIEPLITKVTETDFEKGDKIGLTVTRTAGVFATNEQLTFDGTAFTGSLKWYAEGADEATLTAYYPYAAEVPTSFTIAADQTAGTASSDFVAAKKEGVLPTANAITMLFQHKLSRVVLNLTNNAGYTIDAVTLSGAKPTAVISADFEATVDDNAAPSDIQAFKASATQYHAVVVPQNVTFTLTVTAAGVPMAQRLANFTLLPGKQYTVDVVVNPADITVAVGGNVTAWVDGGPIGEYEVPFEEHLADGYILYDNDRYSVKQLANGRWIMTQSMRFVPFGKTISDDASDGNGIWYPYSSDGTTVTVEKTPEAIAARGLLYDYQVAFGAEITAENFKSFEGTQGICPAGWHIPTQPEFLAIVGASTALDDPNAPKTDTEAIYYDADYKAGRIKTMNEDGFNWDFAGSINRTANTASGAYQKTITKETTCAVAEWVGKNAVTYYMGSTAHTPSNTAINRQFMALMSTFTSTNNEGKCSIAYSNYLSGYALRCIRNAE